MQVFCTLFDSNYLDKGLVMYRSLQNVGCEFRLYILAMDKRCESILNNYCYKNIIVLSREPFVSDMKLSEIEKTRSKSEFCWTCTSHLIEHILIKYNEKICTYIDSDLYFYQNPKCVINEIINESAQIIEHGFGNTIFDKQCLEVSGRFCVEFNTFKNDETGLSLLNWWKEKCRLSCSISGKEEGVFGDQKYLEKWVDNPHVSIVKNIGAGVAPWNIQQYRLVRKDNRKIILYHKRYKRETELVFYHFHSIEHIEKKEVKVPIYNLYWGIDDNLVNELYIPYLTQLEIVKNELEAKFGFYPIIYRHPAFEDLKNSNDVTTKSISYYIRRVFTINKRKFLVRTFRKNFLKMNAFLRKIIQGNKDYIKF